MLLYCLVHLSNIHRRLPLSVRLPPANFCNALGSSLLLEVYTLREGASFCAAPKTAFSTTLSFKIPEKALKGNHGMACGWLGPNMLLIAAPQEKSKVLLLCDTLYGTLQGTISLPDFESSVSTREVSLFSNFTSYLSDLPSHKQRRCCYSSWQVGCYILDLLSSGYLSVCHTIQRL